MPEHLRILSLTKITDRIVLFMTDNKLVTLEEKELYTYGVRRLIFWAINVITIIALGLLFDVLWQLVLYTSAFFFLRSYTGGHHAKTELMCYIGTLLIFSVIISVIKFAPPNSLYLLLFTAFSVCIIFMLAPIDHENKRLDENEFKHYRKRAVIILFLETTLIVATYYVGFTEISLCLNLALMTNCVMVVLGCLENRKI